MNIQYEIAKMACQKWIPDEVIDKELASLSREEWDKQCVMLNEIMKKHVDNCKSESEKEEVMLQDLINMGAANNVDEITVWVAYMKWMGAEFETINRTSGAKKVVKFSWEDEK